MFQSTASDAYLIPRSETPSRRISHRRTRASITGAGAVTALGRSIERTWDALLAGQAIADHWRAEGGSDDKPECSRAIGLARRAAREAIAEAGWSGDLEDAAVVIGTSKGSIESWLTGTGPGTAGLAHIATEIAAMIGARGPRLTISGACASGLLALIRAAMLIESGQVRRALVVATEASVHPLFLGSFRRLGVFPRKGGLCRPFDQRREGFLMSEAAAAVCLEAVDPPDARMAGESDNGNDPPAQGVLVERYAAGGDAWHLTANDPRGELLGRLVRIVVDRRPVDLLHAHGTGTLAHDPVELAAFESVLQDLPASTRAPLPSLYSHKGALGHTLGAAGLVGVVLSRRAHLCGVVPGNVRTTAPLPATRLFISSYPEVRTIRRSITTAAGFGGATAVVSLVSI